ncbi:MAG: hypothetical protein DMG41_29315 [Acidobacteria bacterium]|nr:MAG: hypothetical protein DMG42_04740 [Acidobacteriota bacterium]PYT83932.1 MAG: hypothetical protein DMG41_29315 [Acidobacteriota bacterium]
MQRRRKIMPGLKRIRAVYSFPGQTENVSVHHKNAPLKIFDARVEVRNPVPVPVYLAPLDEPRNRERTVTEDVSGHGARVVTKRYWRPGEVPLLTPLIGEYPKYGRVVYCDPQSQGGYCVGIEFSRPFFCWTGIAP